MKTLTAEQLATRWGLSKGTLANWRVFKKGPPAKKIFGKIVYKTTDVIRYEKKLGITLKNT